MDNSIADLFNKGFVDREEAIARANNPGKMDKMLGQTPTSSNAKRQEKKPEPSPVA
jgi:hypothetical protein